MRAIKVKLFEIIRKDHQLYGKSIHQIAKDHTVHRRTVRQALQSAMPPSRKGLRRLSTVMTPLVTHLIDQWLESDLKAPRRQCHTGTRIYQRLVEEMEFKGAAVTVRLYVKKKRTALMGMQRAYVPQTYLPGEEAEVDWYEAQVIINGIQQKIYFFEMRACYSGREFHSASYTLSQQAFLEAHVQAFLYFGGVFKTIRYDNLTAAVKKVVGGRKRIETERFVMFRSHYLFEAVFCLPGIKGAHEKGGVEGGVGRFRRRHLVPVPQVTCLDELNQYLLSCCAVDDQRIIIGKPVPVLAQWNEEPPNLLKLPDKPFDVTEITLREVNKKSLVSLKNNSYSVPANYAGLSVEVHATTRHILIYKQGLLVSDHERCYQEKQSIVKLEHYLPIMRYKPQSLRKSVALQQSRGRGEWPPVYDHYWALLVEKYGQQKGTQLLLESLWWAYEEKIEEFARLVEMALAQGCFDCESLKHLNRTRQAVPQKNLPLDQLGGLVQFERPMSSIDHYDQLLS